MKRRPGSTGPRGGCRAGVSLVEVLVAMTILTIAFGMYASTVFSTKVQRAILRENAIAAEAARNMLEEIADQEFDAIFALYNETPTDDPGGEGTAPGCRFDVPGLDAWDGAGDGWAGEIVFPALREGEKPGDREKIQATYEQELADLIAQEERDRADGTFDPEVAAEKRAEVEQRRAADLAGLDARPLELREDFVDERMGMPRDLNGDGLTEEERDCSAAYVILPVRVRVCWEGRFGRREYTLHTMITELPR